MSVWMTFSRALEPQPPHKDPTQVFPAKSRCHSNLPPWLLTQKKKWVIGHKVSASLNPLLISLRGLRQGCDCTAKLELAGGTSTATVTSRRAQAWGSLLGSKHRENNNHTHCHHCLPYTWAGFRQKHVCTLTHTTVTQPGCSQDIWLLFLLLSSLPERVKPHKHTHLQPYIKYVLEHSSTPLVILHQMRLFLS